MEESGGGWHCLVWEVFCWLRSNRLLETGVDGVATSNRCCSANNVGRCKHEPRLWAPAFNWTSVCVFQRLSAVSVCSISDTALDFVFAVDMMNCAITACYKVSCCFCEAWVFFQWRSCCDAAKCSSGIYLHKNQAQRLNLKTDFLDEVVFVLDSEKTGS